MLISMGLEQGRAPEWWVVEHPQRIYQAHRAYVLAGSELIHTSTFGASPGKLASVGLEGRCQEINQAAVYLAREACEPTTLVAGDVGPTGLLLPPLGKATEQEIGQALQEQMEALAQAGVDLFSIETMFDLREARVAVMAASGLGLPVMASMTFESRKRGYFTIMGDKLVPSLTALHQAGAQAVGFNCSVTPDVMTGMVHAARMEIEVPLVAQPNAGQPQVSAEGIRYPASAEEFARHLVEMALDGARLVGGCCGTDPSFIQAALLALEAAELR